MKATAMSVHGEIETCLFDMDPVILRAVAGSTHADNPRL